MVPGAWSDREDAAMLYSCAGMANVALSCGRRCRALDPTLLPKGGLISLSEDAPVRMLKASVQSPLFERPENVDV